MRRAREKILMILALALGTAGCARASALPLVSDYPEISRYTGYLEAAEGDPAALRAYQAAEGQDEKVYLENDSPDLFVIAKVSWPEDGREGSYAFPLIRPGSFGQTDAAGIAGRPEVASADFYKLDYPCPVAYDYIEDFSVGDHRAYLDILLRGSYTIGDIEELAKREYIIAVLTGKLVTDYYYYDSRIGYLPDYPGYPDPATAAFYCQADYDKKSISVYKRPGPAEALRQIAME